MKKTNGFFRVQKLPAPWNSAHAAPTLPKICFLGNFSESPQCEAKGHGFTIKVEREKKTHSWKRRSIQNRNQLAPRFQEKVIL